MRLATSLGSLLALSLLACIARADTLDQFSFVSAGLNIEFTLPASVSGSDAVLGGNQYTFNPAPGSLNGVPSTVSAHLIFPGACSSCDTLFLGVTPDDPALGTVATYEFGLPNLYDLTFPGPDSVMLAFLPGTYSSEYIVHAFYDIEPATITVTPQTTAATPEPPSLTLVALATLLSLGVATRGLRRAPSIILHSEGALASRQPR